MKLTWRITPDYLYGGTDKFKFKNKIAFFDLDNTLITSKNGKKFPIDENDWKWRFQNVKNKLCELYNNEYCIIIISNQGGIKSGKQTVKVWTAKLNQIVDQLNLDIRVFCSTGYNKYRKPSPMFFFDFVPSEQRQQLDFKNSFFCGDCAGRNGDFSNSDYKFALNCLLEFKTPEHWFSGGPNIFEKLNPVNSFPTNIPEFTFNKKENEIVIMVGFPGSGKSYIASQIAQKYNYIVINQDKLKTLTKCSIELKKSINDNKSIIIDATNPSKKSRKYWIDKAIKNNYTVRIIKMTTSESMSLHNNAYRCFFNNVKHVPLIAFNIYKSKYEEPTISENVKEILMTACNPKKTDIYYSFYLS